MGLVSEFDAFCVSFSLNSNLVLSAVNYLAKKYIFRVASSLQTRFSILRFSSHLGKRTCVCVGHECSIQDLNLRDMNVY